MIKRILGNYSDLIIYSAAVLSDFVLPHSQGRYPSFVSYIMEVDKIRQKEVIAMVAMDPSCEPVGLILFDDAKEDDPEVQICFKRGHTAKPYKEDIIHHLILEGYTKFHAKIPNTNRAARYCAYSMGMKKLHDDNESTTFVLEIA